MLVKFYDKTGASEFLKNSLVFHNNDNKKSSLPKGEIAAPDAPWLDKK